MLVLIISKQRLVLKYLSISFYYGDNDNVVIVVDNDGDVDVVLAHITR